MKFLAASAILRNTFNEECLLCLHNQHAHGTLFADNRESMARSKPIKARNEQLETTVFIFGVTACVTGIVVTCWSALSNQSLVPWGLF